MGRRGDSSCRQSTSGHLPSGGGESGRAAMGEFQNLPRQNCGGEVRGGPTGREGMGKEGGDSLDGWIQAGWWRGESGGSVVVPRLPGQE